MTVIPISRRPKRKGPPKETAIMLAILEAVNRLPWCTQWRCNTGGFTDRNGRHVTAGLGNGCPDLVGGVEVYVSTDRATHTETVVERFVCLEVKRPGERVKPGSDQQLWHDERRRHGAFVAVVHSVEEALAAIERARDPRCRQ
jgi:hypothetical protein